MSFFTNRLLNFTKIITASNKPKFLRPLLTNSNLRFLPVFNNFNAITRFSSSSSSSPQSANPLPLKSDEQQIDNSKKQESRVIKSDNKNTIFSNVNELIQNKSEGRLFAVIQLCGKQFKVTEGDIVIVEGYWPPTINDRIRLNKILLVGGRDFTLIGRPILNDNLINIQATVIEKTLSHTRTHFRKKRRKQYMRINFYRTEQTMLRINSIGIQSNINENPKITDDKSELQLF